MSTEQIALKVSAAAKAIGISKYTLYDALRAGELPYIQRNPKADKLIKVADLNAWLDKHRVVAA